MFKKRGITFKLVFYILLSCSAVFSIILGYDYFISYKYLANSIDKNVGYMSKIAISKVDAVLQSVEQVPETFAAVLGDIEANEKNIESVLRDIIKTNDKIYGASVSFDSGEFAPYYYKGKKKFEFKDLSNSQADYREMEWYSGAKKAGVAVWSEPYKDLAGSGNIVSTYSVPIFRSIDEKKVFIGVVTADISFDWLQEVISSVDLGGESYGFIISKNGNFLTHPNDNIPRDKTIFNIARKYENERLEHAAKKMVGGESGISSYKRIMDEREGWLVYAPLSSNSWALGMDFPRDEMIKSLVDFDEFMAFLALLGIVLLFAVVYFASRSITKPLRLLDKKTRDIANGEFDFDLPHVSSNDEIGRLSRSLILMRDSLKKYMKELVETAASKERIVSELRIARNIQMSLVPKVVPPFSGREEFDIYAILHPAKKVGGDFYDFFFVGKDQVCLVIGDVADKGIPAALFMAYTKTFIRSLARVHPNPKEILEIVNKELMQNNSRNMFVTVFCGIFDINTGEFVFANGGHNPPLLVSEKGDVSTFSKYTGTVVGVLEKATFKEEKIKVKKGETLFFYTDGVTEAFDLSGKMYGEERLNEVVSENASSRAKALVKKVVKDVRFFSGKNKQTDDITILSMKFMPGYKTEMSEKDTYSLIVKNDLSEVEKIVEFIRMIVIEHGATKSVAHDLNLALEEIFTNTISYGYDDDSEHLIQLDAETVGEEICIKYQDDGKSFNPLEVSMPDTSESLKDRKIGGLGLMFAKKSLDSIEYKRIEGKNCLYLKKSF